MTEQKTAAELRESILRHLDKKYPELAADHPALVTRLELYFGDFWEPYSELYGEHPRLKRRVRRLFRIIAKNILSRDPQLLKLDEARSTDPGWFQQHDVVGMMMYVDLFSGNLKKLDRRIDYLREIGVTYLHLMPLMETREGMDDGGYAVSDFRKVNRKLGTTRQLRNLAHDLHDEGISLVLDLVMNHTAREHKWARKAVAGSRKHQGFYFMFDEREVPDTYEESLPQVFPDFAPGNFTWDDEAGKWVWTTFYDFQWDLNFANPAVFEAMWKEMVFLANVGADVIRLDAVPFIWKRMGTACQNQPETVLLLAAYRALMRMFAPAVAFKAEAIVSPEEIVRYLGVGGREGKVCDIAYNATLMNHMWHSLACENVHLLRNTLTHLPSIPDETNWVNYVRCHDDIGWGISDENAAAVGQQGRDTRKFCSEFFAGALPGSYSEGYRFQVDPLSGEARTSGTSAALTGLQKGIVETDAGQIDAAVRRTLLLNGITFFMRGFPVIYSGDEIGQLNDYAYLDDPLKKSDNRWVHRPPMNWRRAKNRDVTGTVEARLFQGVKRLVTARRGLPVLDGRSEQEIVSVASGSVFVVRRSNGNDEAMMLANFSRQRQEVGLSELPATWLSGRYHDHLAGETVDYSHGDHIILMPYECLWLGHPQSGPSDRTVEVDLRLTVETQPGEMVYLSGSIPQLGEWNPDRAFGPLDPTHYPVWTGSIQTKPGEVFEYVWIKKSHRGVVATEQSPRLHRVNGHTESTEPH